MFDDISWNRKLLAAVAGVNLALAIAVGAGAVPRPGDNRPVSAAAVSAIEDVPATAAREPGDGVTVTAPAEATTTTTAAPATTVPAPKPTTPPTTRPRAAAPKTTTTAAPATAAPAAPATAAAAPVTVPRRTPSAAEINAAISELKRQVGGLLMLVSPTAAQINQAGDQVCTAFDNGQTFAQVKATGLSLIPSTITVSAATAEWAVRQAVTMYCPGHASKLV